MSNNSIELSVTSYTRVPPGRQARTRTVAQEAPLVIHVNGATDYSLMRSPGQDRELTIGFLFTEHLIDQMADIHMLRECQDTPNLVEVTTANPGQWRADRTLLVSSSCGLCGRTDIPALIAGLEPLGAGVRVYPDVLFRVPGVVREQQKLFQATGATHAAAIFDPEGRVLVLREDVGRHCALDKVIGHALLHGIPMAGCGVFLSGRASLEMIIKAVRARFSVVAAVSAPTGAAIDAAQRLGVTLCGFVRGDEITVYTREDRIQG